MKNLLMEESTKAFIKEGKQARSYSLFDLVHGFTYLRWPYLYISVGRGDHPMAKWFKPLEGLVEKMVEGKGRKANRRQTTDDRRDGGEENVEVRGERTEDGGGTRQMTDDRGDGEEDPGGNVAGGNGSDGGRAGLRPYGKTVTPTPFSNSYHGKVVPIGQATQLIRVDRDVVIECPEKVIPYPMARDIVLKNPDHIVVMECPCRASRPEPCKPLDVCLIVGEPFASFVEEHHPQRSRRISRDEAATIIRQEDERGHVHHAFFKDAMLGRFYAICNCCSCCCGAMQSHEHGTGMLASSGYVARVDEEKCEGCGDCSSFCQFGALVLDDLKMRSDDETCMGCGICVSKCVNEAISLVLEPSKGEPLEIETLMAWEDGRGEG